MATTTAPKPTFTQAMRSGYVSTGVQQVVTFALFAALATSRAAGHVLSAGVVAAMVVVAAATATVIGWTANLYGGAFDSLTRAVTPDESIEPSSSDPFATATLWRTTLLWALGAAAWAGAGAGLVAAVLNGRVAKFPIVFVSLTALAGVSVVAVNGAARRRGYASAAATATESVSLRRRAWLHVAVPFALSQALVNGGVAWLLFHAYSAEKLTSSTGFADALLVAVLMTTIFGGITRSMGAFDFATGRVHLDDPDAQTVPSRSPIGLQFMVYATFVGVLLSKLIVFVLPSHPALAAVIVARGAFAGVLVFIAAGFGYVRGACNGLKPSEVFVEVAAGE
ncbi:MAG TPA: hypothetical protein VHC63_08550 [Acidimicrobiales bacterium]|nr:hypothetical protein [Acidimicrobiales bacterium]